jgi:hypothetical protein
MTLPTNKQDLLRITDQRDAIGALYKRPDSHSASDPEPPPRKPPKKSDAVATASPQPAPPIAFLDEAETQITSAPIAPASDPDDAADPMQQDPPHWIQQASLSELLLWRLGVPLDRERIERENKQSEKGLDLKPPITTRKVADAIAHLSVQVIRGELDPASAKTSLYALQTLLTAMRLQLIEEKKPQARKGKKRNAKRAPKQRAGKR